MQPVRILSIDGGGMRGIIPARFLQLLENRLNDKRRANGLPVKPLYAYFDLIAGTSTGGLITAALTVPHPTTPGQPRYSMQQIIDIYLKDGERIFPKPSLWRKMKGYVLGGETLYAPDGIEAVLREKMGNARLSDTLKPLLVCSYDIFNNEPRFFKSREGKTDVKENFSLFHVCRSTSAGPTYFPPCNFVHEGKTFNCIDGGVFINNPSIGALAEIIRHKKFYCEEKSFGDNLSNVYVMSLGTGRYTGQLSIKESKSMSAVKWIQPMLDIMMYGVNQTTDYVQKQVLDPKNYYRFGVEVEEKYSAMDNAAPDALNYWDTLARQGFVRKATAPDGMDELAKIDAFLTNSGMYSEA
jgi:uncharacterized protein